jgi:heat shock protein HslJ
VKPEDLDDHSPIEPGDPLLASVRARSRSFRRHRSTQRVASVMTGLVVLALAGGIAWTRVDSTSGRRVRPGPVASSTTTLPAMTQTEIIGKWRPVSIAGYAGPLTKPPLGWEPRLSFNGRDRWSGSDGCNDIGGTYRLEGNGVHFLTFQSTLVGCSETPDFEPIESAPRSAVRDDQLTFLTADGNEIARFERAGVTARIELPATTMTAGSRMDGRVVVENDTGHEVNTIGCHGLLVGIGLGNAEVHQRVIFPTCADDITIPVGESSYPVDVSASYDACSPNGEGGMPRCLPGGGTPPLPPGIYQATLFQGSPVAPAPPPINVTVEPQSTP